MSIVNRIKQHAKSLTPQQRHQFIKRLYNYMAKKEIRKAIKTGDFTPFAQIIQERRKMLDLLDK